MEERSGRKSLAEIHSLFYQEAKCLENRPCPQPPAPRLESPLLVSSRGSRAVKLARSLLRTPLPFPCQSSGAAAALPPRGRAGDRHPVSPREHGRAQGPTLGTLCRETRHTRSSPSTAAAAKILIIKSSHRSYLKTLKPRAHTAHPGLSESSVSPYPPPPPAPPDPASHSRERRKHKQTPSFPH